MFAVFYFCLFLVVHVRNTESQITSVAVVNFDPTSMKTEDDLDENANKIATICKLIVAEDPAVNLIIFPAKSIMFGVNDSQDLLNYSTHVDIGDMPLFNLRPDGYPSVYKHFMRELSNVSSILEVNLIVNVIESDEKNCLELGEKSRNCVYYGRQFFDTDVVFNTRGTVAQKYRKNGLSIAEKYFDNDLSFVDFSFNGFGYYSSGEILDSDNRDSRALYLYSNSWVPELPFLTSNQMLQMWSQAKSPILASGIYSKEWDTSGSGYYTNNGPIKPQHIITYENSTAFTFSINSSFNEVEAILTNEEVDDLARQKDNQMYKINESLEDFQFEVLDFNRENFTLCTYENSTCCNYAVRTSFSDNKNKTKKGYTYILVANFGRKNLSETHLMGVEICGVLACLNKSIFSCGQRFNNYDDVEWRVRFEEITVEITSSDSNYRRTYFPNSLLSSITPINPTQTEWNSNDTGGSATFKLGEPQDRLLTFAIYGINYDLEVFVNDYNNNFPMPTPSTVPGSSKKNSVNVSILLLFVMYEMLW